MNRTLRSLPSLDFLPATERTRGTVRAPGLTVSTSVSFASLWLIPRLSSFRAPHAGQREDVGAFLRWVGAEAARECEAAAPKSSHGAARN